MIRGTCFGVRSERALLDRGVKCDTVCHMNTISIRELHAATGKWVRQAAVAGEVHVTERGRIVARLVPAKTLPPAPYFAARKLTAAYRKHARFMKGGTDATAIVSEDRDRGVS